MECFHETIIQNIKQNKQKTENILPWLCLQKDTVYSKANYGYKSYNNHKGSVYVWIFCRVKWKKKCTLFPWNSPSENMTSMSIWMYNSYQLSQKYKKIIVSCQCIINLYYNTEDPNQSQIRTTWNTTSLVLWSNYKGKERANKWLENTNIFYSRKSDSNFQTCHFHCWYPITYYFTCLLLAIVNICDTKHTERLVAKTISHVSTSFCPNEWNQLFVLY